MKHQIPSKIDSFLTRRLSGAVFTWRGILQMTVPFMLDSLSVMLIGMLITALISSNGQSSMAAVALVGPVTNLVVCMFNGIGTGDRQRTARACTQVIWLTVIIGVASCLPLLIFPDAVLLALYPDAEAEVLRKASIYLTGSTWSILAFVVYTAMYSVLRGLGESQKCLILSVIINAAYLIFSIVFLNVLKLDIQGSVYALILARILGALCAIALLFFIHPPISMPPKQLFSFGRQIVGSTLRVSVPLGLEQIFSTCGSIVAGMFMVQLGTSAVAVNAISNSLLSVLYAAATSAATLAVTLVGRCIGAERQEEARRYSIESVHICFAILALTSVVFFPLMPLPLNQYHPTPERAVTAKKLLFLSLPALFIFWPMSYTMPSSLRAANDTLFPSIFSLAVL